MLKEIKINAHGNYIYATLDGVDFVTPGIAVNEKTGIKTPYGASIKLKFIIQSTIYKSVNGIDIATKRANSQIFQIPCTEDKIPLLVAKYNELVGQDMFIQYSMNDGAKIKLNNENEISIIK